MDFRSRYKYNPKEDLLGKGGFSRVFKAVDVLLEREVALKVFNSEQSARYDLITEIKKVIRFHHENLCRYYDVAILQTVTAFGEEEHVQVGVMEYLDGGDLKSYLSRNPQYLNKLLADVLQGLNYLHKKNIIHRDLKPQNILIKLEEDGPVAKITDFGISKAMDDQHDNSSALLGTVEYMAPEQFNPQKYGLNGQISTHIDLWSFGIMVYELIVGQSLFGSRSHNTSAERVMSNILGEEYLEKLKLLPEPYNELVGLCLVKKVSERVKSADVLLNILDKSFGGNWLSSSIAISGHVTGQNDETLIIGQPAAHNYPVMDDHAETQLITFHKPAQPVLEEKPQVVYKKEAEPRELKPEDREIGAVPMPIQAAPVVAPKVEIPVKPAAVAPTPVFAPAPILVPASALVAVDKHDIAPQSTPAVIQNTVEAALKEEVKPVQEEINQVAVPNESEAFAKPVEALEVAPAPEPIKQPVAVVEPPVVEEEKEYAPEKPVAAPTPEPIKQSEAEVKPAVVEEAPAIVEEVKESLPEQPAALAAPVPPVTPAPVEVAKEEKPEVVVPENQVTTPEVPAEPIVASVPAIAALDEVVEEQKPEAVAVAEESDVTEIPVDQAEPKSEAAVKANGKGLAKKKKEKRKHAAPAAKNAQLTVAEKPTPQVAPKQEPAPQIAQPSMPAVPVKSRGVLYGAVAAVALIIIVIVSYFAFSGGGKSTLPTGVTASEATIVPAGTETTPVIEEPVITAEPKVATKAATLASSKEVASVLVTDMVMDKGFQTEHVYTGYAKNGVPDGQGEQRFRNGASYKGTFSEGAYHGKGTYTLANGNVFELQWNKGKGVNGTFKFPNGNIYQGAFMSVDGNYYENGKGSMTWADGDKYVGNWIKGKKTNGTFYYKDGSMYKGTFVNDKREGKGKFMYANGAWYEGEFKNNEFNGLGERFDSNGELLESGTFKNGVLSQK